MEDEYDVQDLLHGLIRAYVKYSIQEEPLGKIAGNSSRVDIAIEDLGILVEVKYVHNPNDQARIFKDLSSDQELYIKWEPLKVLICLIYNSGDLRDPESMEKLSGTRMIRDKQFEMYVVIA
ncbi:PD-(D/E)XK nuclease domain-containing protein [Coleofasciculus sp. D1-CHI-01]|uniref:PD-(D/E)XK nuclease domain-containing protein n=1 Tax=Coleofasciculus sp. D1-CHI-01 TaxID=3068482 RepID=UPI00406475AD